MKILLYKTLLLIIAIAFILGMIFIAEMLTKLITMNFIMAVVYITIALGFIYLLKN